ncbi:MAG: hypothetical protein AB8G18_07300 [Gammaproteobacteria bacterium]
MPISLERRDLALECGDMGRHAHAENLFSQCPRFLLEPDEARVIIDNLEKAVKNQWYSACRREGVSEKDCETIKTAFAYDGFRLPIANSRAPG